MKKLTLILILLVWLAGCNNNWKETGNNISQDNLQTKKVSHPELVSGPKADSWELQKKEVKTKKNSFSILKKELDDEFNFIWSYNKCSIMLNTNYKNKEFVLYRNKWAGIETWWCKLSGVEKIWVMWYHNWKADPDGEYVLKSYNKETGLFKYAMSEKYWDLWIWNNEYEFRFYLTGGKVVKEKLNNDRIDMNEDLYFITLNNNTFNRIWVYKILKEKCWVKDFDISKIPTEKWKEIYLTCNGDDSSLIYTWNNEYILKVDNAWEWLFSINIQNWKITKEWYNICWKWFNTLEEFRNLTWELAVWDIWSNNCKFIDITSWFKYSGYYVNWKLITKINNIFNGIDWKPTWIFYINDNKNKSFYCYKTKSSSWCENNLNWKFTFKFTIKKIEKWFLLYTDKWKLLKIAHNNDTDAYWYSIYKTFLNWKEVK